MSSLLAGVRRSLRYGIHDMAWAVLSIPMALKVLGIGMIISGLLSTLTVQQVHYGVSTALRAELEKQGASLLTLTAYQAQEYFTAVTTYSLDERLARLAHTVPDAAYISIEDLEGNLLAVGGPGIEPGMDPRTAFAEETVVVGRKELEAPVPAVVRVGMSTAGIESELRKVMLSLVWWLTLCIALVVMVILALTHLLVRPIRQLVEATTSLREGNYATRAKEYSGDEIGALAQAFNDLAGNLQQRQREVEEKEAARVSLIKHIVHSQEAERKMLARNLHDEIGQSLSHLLVKVQGMCSQCLNTPELSVGLSELIDETRRLAWDFRPSILDDFGLEMALKRYVQEHCAPANIEAECECVYLGENGQSKGRLPNEVEVTLYRIMQEALTNVIRHAGANHVSIVLLKSATEATLIVEDDGCGYDPAGLEHSGRRHLGLIGMQERAQLLGGKMAIETEPGHGTTVRVSVSFEHAEV